MGDVKTLEGDSYAGPVVDANVLAIQRTELAYDRTQLAWVRTAFTCVTAGLAIDKGAEALHTARVVSGHNWVAGSHFVGVMLAGSSAFFLLISSYVFWQETRRLARLKGAPPRQMPLALFLSILVGVLGAALSVLMLSAELSLE